MRWLLYVHLGNVIFRLLGVYVIYCIEWTQTWFQSSYLVISDNRHYYYIAVSDDKDCHMDLNIITHWPLVDVVVILKGNLQTRVSD